MIIFFACVCVYVIFKMYIYTWGDAFIRHLPKYEWQFFLICKYFHFSATCNESLMNDRAEPKERKRKKIVFIKCVFVPPNWYIAYSKRHQLIWLNSFSEHKMLEKYYRILCVCVAKQHEHFPMQFDGFPMHSINAIYFVHMWKFVVFHFANFSITIHKIVTSAHPYTWIPTLGGKLFVGLFRYKQNIKLNAVFCSHCMCVLL